jgi:quinol monooxygenase YgiN
MASHVHLDLAIDPARLDAFLAFLKPLLPDTRAYAGFRSVDVLVDEDKPGHVVFQEVWESRAHYEKYLAWRTETGALAQLGEYLTAPPAFAYFSLADV